MKGGPSAEPGRPRVKRPEARRAELLTVARKLLLTRDVADVTVADITTAAGAAKGTFYRYFARKEDLLMALRMEFVHELSERLAGHLGMVGELEPRERIAALVRTSIRFQIGNQRLHTVLFHQLRVAHTSGTYESPEREHLIDMLTQFIERGNADGIFTVTAPAKAARLLYHALNGGRRSRPLPPPPSSSGACSQPRPDGQRTFLGVS
jgi:AcrR family transcriptional regulator